MAALALPELEPIQRLTRDLKKAAATLSPAEARYLVDAYYSIQEYRKASGNQVKALTDAGEPCSVIVWLNDQMENLENQIKRALDAWTDGQPMGRWSKSITGIGPVIAAGLLAHIEITKAPTVGHIWRFAGLDATVEWLGTEKARQVVIEVMGSAKTVSAEHLSQISVRVNRSLDAVMKLATDDKGAITKKALTAGLAKRPWNAGLKVLCWKIGQSFVKVSNNPKDFYGKLYQQRKALEQANNEAGRYADQAAKILASKNIGKDTEAYTWYSQGKLPPAHIQARSERYAVKLFLSHFWEVYYRHHYKTEPPKPFAISVLGHAHYVPPPQSI